MEKQLITVQIITPERRVVERQAEMIIFPGVSGLFGALCGHEKMIAKLTSGTLEIHNGDIAGRYLIGAGVVDISENLCLVLIQSCEKLAE